MSGFSIRRLDHVNLRTANLDAMTEFYTEVIGLRPGPRPAFPFPGAWLYCGDTPVLHLVGIEQALRPREPQIEHFAFSATGLDDFTGRLQRHGLDYRRSKVPGTSLTQVHLCDSDGNHLHVDFEGQP